MAIRKIPRQNVSDTVFETLRQEIISGVFKPGEKLPSAANLGRQFGVSVATIKLALNRLQALGLIETKNGLGSFALTFDPSRYLNQVTDFLRSENDISDVTEFRMRVEPVIAELAMQNACEENFLTMETILAEMDEAAREKDFRRHGNLDYRFHLEISRATQNIVFVLAYELIGRICHQHTAMLNDLYHRKNTKPEQAGQDIHWKLYRAIKNRDIKTYRKCYGEMLLNQSLSLNS